MKRLILINGAMGAGKTSVSRELLKLIPPCAFLDGDWCWTMNPFIVNDETKSMAMENAVFLLNQFLRCSAYENVVFCWVMHEQRILDELVSRITPPGVQTHTFTLTLSPETLAKRLNADIGEGLRAPGALERSLARLPLYKNLNTVKINTDFLTPLEAAERIGMAILN